MEQFTDPVFITRAAMAFFTFVVAPLGIVALLVQLKADAEIKSDTDDSL